MKFISNAPVRISLCNGGDTDYYIESMGWGNLINTSLLTHGYSCVVEPKNQNYINYTYINRFHNKKSEYKINSAEQNNENISLLTETIKEIQPNFKGDIQITTNVPEKSGLGGSSSLVVSILKSLTKSQNKKLTPEEIAKLAYKIERINLGVKGGYQDQWAAAFGGGVNYLEFRKNNIFLEPLWLHEELMHLLETNLILFYLEPRMGDSGQTHAQLEKSFKTKHKESLEIMINRRKNVLKTRETLLKADLKTFANLLNEEQKNKELLNPSTTTSKSKILYDAAIEKGATAGKISGAGQGGCAFFIAEPKYQENIIKKLHELGAIHLPMKLERLNMMGSL